MESDSGATNFYPFFQRMTYSADLINRVVAHIHNLPDAPNGNVTETIVDVCEVGIHNWHEGERFNLYL